MLIKENIPLLIFLVIQISPIKGLFNSASRICCRKKKKKNSKIAPKVIITNPRRSDGFGAQFQAIIAAAIYAELNKMDFLYTPFQSMEHNYNNDPDFLVKKESFINFIGNFDTLYEKGIPEFPVVSDIDFKAFFDAHIIECAYSKTLQKIKAVFKKNKNIDNFFKNSAFNIAIHIRRPNTHDNRLEGADVPDAVFLKIINQLQNIYAEKNILFHIYSQGEVKDFKSFQNVPNIIFHLNETVEDTFLAMVLANVLVTSPSSLSYTAALLSDGEIFYIPFWHQPLPHWRSINVLFD